jgi:ribosomal protein RSM22 (predicted rRNA methylase)
MVITSELTRELLLLEEHVVNFVLSEPAKKQYKLGKVGKKELDPYVQLLSAISTQYLGAHSVKLSRQQVAAYALYYLPINFAKLAHLFRQELNFNFSRAIRVLDFGCGPGTGALAAASSFNSSLEISLFDASSECSSFAKQLLESYIHGLTATVLSSLTKLQENSFDLVIAANVLTELSGNTRQATIDQLLQLVAKDGYLVLLEPALKTFTQNIMSDRDQILANNRDYSVIFPCFLQNACPMLLEGKDDWCHGELPNNSWERPPLLRQMDELLEFNKHRVKYAAFIFQRSHKAKLSGYRVLRPLTKKHAALLCGEKGLLQIDARQAKEFQLKHALKNADVFSELSIIIPESVI